MAIEPRAAAAAKRPATVEGNLNTAQRVFEDDDPHLALNRRNTNFCIRG